MKVTKLDTGELVLAVPEAWNVSSALAEGRDVGHPLIFWLAHDDAVKLALAIAVIPVPGTTDPKGGCPNCGSMKSSWYLHKQAGPHAPPQPHNRMSLNDVQVLVLRACDDCSETLESMDAEDFIDKVVRA